MTRLLPLLALLLATAACTGDRAAGDAPPTTAPARQYVVLLDLSGSQSAAKRQEAARAVDHVLQELSPGDRVVLLQVHQGSASEDGAVRWSDSVPHPRHGAVTTLDRENVDKTRRAARSVAENIFAQEQAGRLPTTDLLSTLHVAGEFVRDAGGRRTSIVVLSDMLQDANGIDLARAPVPNAAWVRAQVVPRLGASCIAVIGADATSPRGVAVREFWKTYFQAAGADLRDENYRLISTGGGVSGCM